MPLPSFIRYISKHLPKDIRSTIRTREVANIAELEKILEAYQSMKEEEDNKYQFRDTEVRQPDHFINNVSRSGEGAWLCPNPNCRANNYNSSRNQCYRCQGPRESAQGGGENYNRGFEHNGFRGNHRGRGFTSNRGVPGNFNHRGRGGYASNPNDTRGVEAPANNQNNRGDHRGVYSKPPPPIQLN